MLRPPGTFAQELRISSPGPGDIVNSPVAVSLAVDVQGVVPNDWRVCYDIAGRRRCVSLDATSLEALPATGDVLLEAWIQNKTHTIASAQQTFSVVTSLSDTVEYKEVVRAAVDDEEVFKTFKRHPSYHVLEHLTPKCGDLYVEALQCHLDAEILKALAFNTDVGSPRVVYESKLGRLSPTTLRYAKVACDLMTLFPNLRELVEIGVGYGGLPQALLSFKAHLTSVLLVDLPDVERLALKYLHTFQRQYGSPGTIFRTYNKTDEDFDLVVNNYALSELTTEVQLAYFDSIIRRARRGYLTINPVNGLFNAPVETVVARLEAVVQSPVFVAREVPLSFVDSGKTNYILLWGLPEDAPRIHAFLHRWSHDSISTYVPAGSGYVPTCQLVVST